MISLIDLLIKKRSMGIASLHSSQILLSMGFLGTSIAGTYSQSSLSDFRAMDLNGDLQTLL